MTLQGETSPGRRNFIKSIVFSPDSKTVASGGDKLQIWDVTSRKRVYTTTRSISDLAVSLNGKLLVSMGNKVTVWDFKSKKSHKSFTIGGGSWNTVFVSPSLFASAPPYPSSYSKNIVLWGIPTGKTRLLHGHKDDVRDLALLPGNGYLVSASYDGSIKVWDVKKNKAIQTIQANTNRVYSIDVTADGKTLISTSGDKSIKIWKCP